VSLPRGYNEAGAEWLEPWCDEHPDLDGQGCVACIGASHDAWMHRAKAAEAEVARLREALSTAAGDLDKAANQFEGIRQAQKAGHEVPVVSNSRVFAAKAQRAREALEAGER
jgi:hypothetical protein